MTTSAVLAVISITAVVWIVMSVRSSRLQAAIYSFPIPMTIALLATSNRDPAGAFLGVPLLASFLFIIALLVHRTGRIVAVLAALIVYIAVAAAIHRWVDLGAGTALAMAVALLAVFAVIARRVARNARPVEKSRPGALEYAAVPVVTAATWALGSVLGPFVVTFPFSGVPTTLALRSGHRAFAVGFTAQTWLILGFLVLMHVLDAVLPLPAALAAGWLFFLAGTAAMTALLRRRG